MSVADIAALLTNLSDRAANAAIGRSRIVNDTLREALRDLVRRPPGAPGGFLAEPLIEAVFGWKSADRTMQQLADEGVLVPSLVDALGKTQPITLNQERERNTFPRNRRPYLHQLESWRALTSGAPRPLVVTSGTGSGKTECFLVPILNDLARQTASRGRLIGVQALFLYPLNALIASQRDRLSDWTEPFGGDVRFCLYNGNTPEEIRQSEARETPWEVRDRKTLRAAPPPILVTNATMLEYMLIRTADKPLLGQGQLRWIVLDEAHSYVGSQAAEMTLLLRRTMHAFGVTPQDVRFIATSATLGNDAATEQRLRQFTADLSGRLEQEVVVVHGEREVPDLEPGSFDGLAEYPEARALRSRLAKGHASLCELSAICPGENVTNLLMHCVSARDMAGQPFLPIRLHLFHRSQSGVWACIDATCVGRVGTRLDSPAWPFGSVMTRDAPKCHACGGLTLQLLLCDDCGEPFLEAAGDAARTRVLRYREPLSLDEFAAEADVDDDVEDPNAADVEASSVKDSRILLAPPGLRGGAVMRIDPCTGTIPEVPREGLRPLGRHEPIEGCPCCGAGNSGKRRLFRPLRLGGPFMTGIAADTLLDAAPPAHENAALKPHGGRQMITFTDSRQGTARFAASWQLEAERTYARSVLFHALQSASSTTVETSLQLDQEIADLEKAIANSPGIAGLLGPTLAGKRIERGTLPPGRLSWREAKDILASRNDQQSGLRKLWADRDPDLGPNDHLAQLQLFAEFLRRPTRGNNLETMGLAALRFEGIDKIRDAPELFSARGASADDWRDFLRICITHGLRASRACFITDSLRNWVGQRARPRAYVGHDFKEPLRGTDLRWPMVKAGTTPRSRLVRLLVKALNLDLTDASTCHSLNELLMQAYRSLHIAVGHDVAEVGRLQLDLTRASLVRLDKAWICPVTRRLLDRTLRGITPYLPPESNTRSSCAEVDLPTLPYPWLRDAAKHDRLAEVEVWLRTDPVVEARRRDGVWTDLHDRLARLPPFIRVAEHSAQQPASRLKTYEDDFKAGRLNALACSTTMEMGVDIGGITTVAMTNVPPAPANYRQRVGRAGRRGEALAIAFTYCADDPLGWSAFDHPAQPLEQPIHPPRVAMDSRLIVQRHVNALLVAGFLADPNWQPPNDKTKLAAVWFFGAADDPTPPWRGFISWLERNRADKALLTAMAMLVAGSGLADMPDLTDACAEQIETMAMSWRDERDQLRRDLDKATGSAKKAITMQLQRMENEFLLKELTSAGLLPGHGFPTGIVPFVALSPADLARHETKGRDDGNGRFREFPSRGIETAIREYAPGADIVLDGLVYRSAGITLNWQLPASEQAVQEIQAIRHFWQCPCGAAGTARRVPEQCSACGRAAPSHEKVLIPAGFSTDLSEKPDGAVELTSFVPMVKPAIFAPDAQWVALANPEAGRMRASANGIIMGVSRGANGSGYALCMACGRAEPETGGANPLATHRPLRNGRQPPRCDAASDSFTIQRQIRLGYHRTTNVCEFQFASITSDAYAITAVVALREALVRYLGIERGEIGWAIHARPGPTGGNAWSMFLYDTAAGGAGYAAAAVINVPRLLDHAIEILDCRNPDCNSACPSCLITRDTLQNADALDRRSVLAVFAELRDAVVLPEGAKVFSGQQRIAVQPIVPSLDAALSRIGADTLLLRLPGASEGWDLASWWAAPVIERHARQGRQVILLADTKALTVLPLDASVALFALTQRGGGRVCLMTSALPSPPTSLIAAVRSGLQTTAWATRHSDEILIGPTPPQAIVVCDTWTWPETMTQFDLVNRLSQPRQASVRLPINRQLDGNISDFGSRFWMAVGQGNTPAVEWLATLPRLRAIEYDDRYLFSPLAVVLLEEILRSVPRGPDAKPSILVRTQDMRQGGQSYGFPTAMHHDWSDAATRDEVIRGLLSPKFVTNIHTASRNQLPHARMLRLIAEDGSRLEIMLDQGLGYWRTSRTIPFDFNLLARNQVRSLLGLNFHVMASSEFPTWVIVESMASGA